MKRFFGFELSEDISDIPALQPELRDSVCLLYFISKWWHNIHRPMKQETDLGFEPIEGDRRRRSTRSSKHCRKSATNPDEGGRPVEEDRGINMAGFVKNKQY